MVHYPLILSHWRLYGTLLSSTGPLDIPIVHNPLLTAQWLSLWYTILPYWTSVYPYGTLLSSIDPLDISMVHSYLLLAHWLSIWYTTIFYWPTGYLYGTLPPLFSHWRLYGTLLSSTDPLAIPMVHNPPLLAHWLSLWYTTIFYWPTEYLFDTLPSPIGPLATPMVHTIFYWPTGYLWRALRPPIGTLAVSIVHYYLLLAHWLSLWYTTIFYSPNGYLWYTYIF